VGESNASKNFRFALEAFANDLTANYSTLVPGQPEDQLKSPVRDLLLSAALSRKVLNDGEGFYAA